MTEVAGEIVTVGAVLADDFVVNLYIGEVKFPREFDAIKRKKYLVTGVKDPKNVLVATTSLPLKAEDVGVAVLTPVAKVASVENSTRAVVLSPSGLMFIRTRALVPVTPSRFVNSTFGAAYAGQESVGER